MRSHAPLSLAALTVLAALAGCIEAPTLPVEPGATGDAALPALLAPLLVDPQGGAGEPSLLVTDDGSIYVAAPRGSARNRGDGLWVSRDGGASFEYKGMPTYPFGGGDTDLAVDDAGTIYMPGQWGARPYVGDNPSSMIPLVGGPAPGYPFPVCESMAVSKDGGESWTVNPVACVYAGAVDRQWVDTVGAGTVYMAFNQIPGGLAVVKSTDSGLTWTPLKVPSEGITENEFSFRGNLATDKTDGTIYVGHTSASGPAVWVSDGSTDFQLKQVHETENWAGYIFNVVAVGTDGTVYDVWAEDLGEAEGVAIRMSWSTDKGETWAEPVKVSSGARTAIFPWVAAGDAGRVAVAWYATDEIGTPGEVSENATWDAYLAVATDALDADGPTFAEAKATEKPLHVGPVCTNGSGCDPSFRRLLDFFEIAIGPDGRVHMILTDDTAGLDQPVVNLYVAQGGGPLMLAEPASG